MPRGQGRINFQKQHEKTLPLDMVGGNTFGRYPKIGVQQTMNMIVSDGFLVPYSGYINILAQDANQPFPHPINGGVGRQIYTSTKYQQLVLVIGNVVYLGSPTFVGVTLTTIGIIETFTGDVFIAEDNQGNIAICDKKDIWIYNPNPPKLDPSGSATYPVFMKAFSSTNLMGGVLDFTPGYIAFQNTRLISVDLDSSQWRLSNPLGSTTLFPGNNRNFPFDAQHVGSFQTKSDTPLAAFPFPGRGNLLFVMGNDVTELWTDQGSAVFPYVRSSGINIDYGCANSDTISTLDNMIVWLGINERSGPVILVSTGGNPTKLSNDGIDFALSNLANPKDSHGFMYKQDGHIIYQITFPSDNISYAYDFNTGMFFTVTDQNQNYHIAKNVAFINNTYYFVSLKDANFYQFDTSITNYNYGYNSAGHLEVFQIPRGRICSTNRVADGSTFVGNSAAFPIEQGVNGVTSNYIASVDITNGGSGYTLATVTFVGGGGTGATAIPIIQGGIITSIQITSPGYGYISPPTVVISGANTTPASATTTTAPYLPSVDISISYNGGYSFTGNDRLVLNSNGLFRNRFIYYNLGWSNELTMQFRFNSFDRIVVGNGLLSVYQ